jgi:hypothetical protein
VHRLLEFALTSDGLMKRDPEDLLLVGWGSRAGLVDCGCEEFGKSCAFRVLLWDAGKLKCDGEQQEASCSGPYPKHRNQAEFSVQPSPGYNMSIGAVLLHLL